MCPAKDKKQLSDDTKDYVKNYEDQKRVLSANGSLTTQPAQMSMQIH